MGAKSALGRGRLETLVCQDITSPADDLIIYQALIDFTARFREDPRPFQSFTAIFADAGSLTEETFEAALWTRLQSVSNKDAWFGQRYDPRVSEDVDSPHFSLSFGGEAVFVVGLRPAASRPARRFETPVPVINPHNQFEQLRAAGQYKNLRRAIMQRDLAVRDPTIQC